LAVKGAEISLSSRGTVSFIYLLRLALPCLWTFLCTDTETLSGSRETVASKSIALNICFCLIVSSTFFLYTAIPCRHVIKKKKETATFPACSSYIIMGPWL
jgi:hypothetical protein